MTHDGLPADTNLIKALTDALFSGDDIAVAYARQLPATDCNIIERHTRDFNYPDKSRVKRLSDLDTLGIKTYFCSNVCAAYKREIYRKLWWFYPEDDLQRGHDLRGEGHEEWIRGLLRGGRESDPLP